MRSQPNIEVAIGNLKLSQAKSQLGKLKLQPLCYSGGFLAPCNFSFFSWALPFLVINSYLSKKKKKDPKGGRDQSLRSRPKETLNITKPCHNLILRS